MLNLCRGLVGVLLLVNAQGFLEVIQPSLRSTNAGTRNRVESYSHARRSTSLFATPDDNKQSTPEPSFKSSREEKEDPFSFMASPGLQDTYDIGPGIQRKARGARKVPMDQQPFNELQNLKQAPLFGWAQKDLVGFCLRLGTVYAMAFAVSLSISSITFPREDQRLQELLSTNVGALGVTFMLILRLYAGWDYVARRLNEEIVPYEESGWYDQATWVKPPAVRARDEMLNLYEVQPVLRRLQVALGIGMALFSLTVLGYKLVEPTDPYEMYTPTYLQRLQTDDEKAREAAERAGNKPAYCANRYYKALGGGLGCDD